MTLLRSTIIKSDGKKTKAFMVSTVKLPSIYGTTYYGGYSFETMVFPLGRAKYGRYLLEDIACNRYMTKDEAKRGHAEMCEGVLNGTVY